MSTNPITSMNAGEVSADGGGRRLSVFGFALIGLLGLSSYRACSNAAGHEMELITYYLIAAGALLAITLKLRTLHVGNAALWFFVAVLVAGTFPKLSILMADRDDPEVMVQEHPELLFVSYSDIVQAHRLAAFSMVLVAIFVISLPPPDRKPAPWVQVPSSRRVKALLTVTLLLGSLATALTHFLGLAILGNEVVRLPLGLDIVINRTRSDVAPSLALLALYYAIRTSCCERTALILVVSLAAGNSFVTTSRGTIFLSAISVALLYHFTGSRARRRRTYAMAGLVVLMGLIAFPFFSALRMERVTGEENRFALQDVFSVGEVSGRVLTRIQGADGLLTIERSLRDGDTASLSDKFSGSALSLGPYYTHQIVRVDTPNDFRSPGFIGAAMLLAGPAGFPLVLVLFPAVATVASRVLVWVGVPAVSCVLVVQFVLELSEGTLAVKPAVFFVFTLFGVAVVHNQLARDDPNRHGTDSQ